MERNQLKIFARNVLSQREYSRFKTALKAFERKECIVTFCNELLEMVNAPEKTDLLVELRRMLPKNKQSKFNEVCRDLVNGKRTTVDKRSSPCEVDCKENRDALNVSPSKRARRKGCQSKLHGNAVAMPESNISHKQESKKPLVLQQQVIAKDERCHRRRHPATRVVPIPTGDENHSCQVRDEKSRNYKQIIMERESTSVNFGFKIQGDLFTEREIVVGQVDKNSIAESSGLHVGDRITRINDVNCKRARKSEIVKLTKSAKKLNMRVISNEHFKGAQDVHVQEQAVTIATNEEQGYNNTKQVTIFTDDDGWMGCSVRGGIDYDCEVHIISVENGSPAQIAGLSKGDVITEVNGVSLHGTTHVQAVRLILTASPPVTFTVKQSGTKHNGTQRIVSKDSHLNNNNNLPHTPLRINGHRSRRSGQTMSDILPFQSAPLPRYWFQNENLPVDPSDTIVSPSNLPLHDLHLEYTPPPPYTAEPPEMHRVIQMGGNIMTDVSITAGNCGNLGPVLPIENDIPSYDREDNSLSMGSEGLRSTRESQICNDSSVNEVLTKRVETQSIQLAKENDVSSSNEDENLCSLSFDSTTTFTENCHSILQQHQNHGVDVPALNEGRDACSNIVDKATFKEKHHSSLKQLPSPRIDVPGFDEDDICCSDIESETTSTKNCHSVLQQGKRDGIHDPSDGQVVFTHESNDANKKPNVDPNNGPCLLDAIRNFNPGLLKSAKQRNISCFSDKTSLPSDIQGSVAVGDGEVQVEGSHGSMSSESHSSESSASDLRAIVNQALIMRRANILNSSQESANESYSSDWDF